VICNSCGCEYKQVKSWQKFCSKKCKDVEFFLRNPNARSTYNKKSAQSPNFKYHVHKNGAKKRGIGFLLSFEEWWSIWEPFWDRRGRTKDSLVMCRYGDTGPYAKDNVYIDTYSNNSKLAVQLKPQKKDKLTGRFV
jgi:hypothetical protein